MLSHYEGCVMSRNLNLGKFGTFYERKQIEIGVTAQEDAMFLKLFVVNAKSKFIVLKASRSESLGASLSSLYRFLNCSSKIQRIIFFRCRLHITFDRVTSKVARSINS